MLVRTLKYPFDQTVAGYIGTATSVLLNIALIVALLGFFGIETTTFAALMAGVGIAIGAAWSGLLAHLAAGIFLLILRPFKAGDFISAGGMMGTVEEIGLFVTRINTLDNVQTYVSNSRVFADTIQNFSANPVSPRRPDGAAPQRRGPRDRHPSAQGAREADSERQGGAAAGRRDPAVQPARPHAGGATRTATTSSTGRCTSTPTG